MRQLTQSQLESQVNTFNEAFKVGDMVNVYKTSKGKELFTDIIVHKASILGGHTAVTWLKGIGSYDLTFVHGRAEEVL